MTLGQLIMDLKALQAEYGSSLPVVVDVRRIPHENIDQVSVILATRDIQGEYFNAPDGIPVVVVELAQ